MFFNLDKRYTYIILAILVLINISEYLANPMSLIPLLLTLPGVIIGITFHEFAHAYAADKLGDDTPRQQGRLNLNPLSHLDPVGFILLLFAHIGWGKPVEINPRNFNRKRSMAASEAIVSIAGPAMNMILAIVFLCIMCILYKFAFPFCMSNIGSFVLITLEMASIVNIGQGLFNLIPLPPLDGSKVLYNFLSYNAKTWFKEHEQLFYFIFLAIWISGVAGRIVSPLIDIVYSGLSWLVGWGLFRIPMF